MGAIETMMIDCAYDEIGKRLGLPTQAYIALCDAKPLDAQAGLETGMGAVLAGLVRHQQRLRARDARLRELPEPGEARPRQRDLRHGAAPARAASSRATTSRRVPLFEELLREGHLLIADHTRQHLQGADPLPGAGRSTAPRSAAGARRGSRPSASGRGARWSGSLGGLDAVAAPRRGEARPAGADGATPRGRRGCRTLPMVEA